MVMPALACACPLMFLLALPAASGQATSACADAQFLANWQACSGPIIANLSVLDLALPGSHDTMTYDLSTALSDGYEGLPLPVSKILHALTPLVAGEFIRDQGRTQGVNITAQLEGGLRFIDFRTLYTGAPAGHPKDKTGWYCLHGCQTNSKSLDYLQQVRPRAPAFGARRDRADRRLLLRRCAAGWTPTRRRWWCSGCPVTATSH